MKNEKSIFSVAESTHTQRLRCQKPWRGGVGLWKIHSVGSEGGVGEGLQVSDIF